MNKTAGRKSCWTVPLRWRIVASLYKFLPLNCVDPDPYSVNRPGSQSCTIRYGSTLDPDPQQGFKRYLDHIELSVDALLLIAHGEEFPAPVHLNLQRQ